MYAIGIDLGTTNCCAAYFRDNQAHLIPLEDGNNTLPSKLFYDSNGEVLLGRKAERKATKNPKNFIFDAKRMIGLDFTDPSIQQNKSLWPFDLHQNPDDQTCEITIKRNENEIKLSPVEISAKILEKIKDAASDYLNEPISDAVVTIPAYFTNSQREATLRSAELAGLNVLKLINEPTAAAVAYAHRHQNQDCSIFVYDLGGGTFDVSIVQFQNGVGKVVALNGDSNLGGRDLDDLLLKFILNEMGIISEVPEMSNEKMKICENVRKECRNVKENLSEMSSSEFVLDSPEFSFKVTKEEFERISKDFFKKTIKIVEKTLKDSPIKKDQIDDVIMVGGSSRIPRLRQLLKDVFDGKEPLHGINEDEAVATGAAIEAANLLLQFSDKVEWEETEKYTINDITRVNYGIAANLNNQMSVVIQKGKQIPVKMKKSYYTTFDNQKSVKIRIYEGDEKFCKDNTFLGEFTVDDLTPAPGGCLKIKVIFEIDNNGIFQASAVEKLGGKKRDMKVNYIR